MKNNIASRRNFLKHMADRLHSLPYIWGIGQYYAIIVSFFTFLFFGDWMTAESDAKDMIYDVITPYY